LEWFLRLIQAGTFDQFNTNRTMMVYEAQLWNVLKPKEKKAALDYAAEQNMYRVAPLVLALLNKTLKDEKGKPIIKDSRLTTIRNILRNTKRFMSRIKLTRVLLTGGMKNVCWATLRTQDLLTSFERRNLH
jgi:hypothetical protein